MDVCELCMPHMCKHVVWDVLRMTTASRPCCRSPSAVVLLHDKTTRGERCNAACEVAIRGERYTTTPLNLSPTPHAPTHASVRPARIDPSHNESDPPPFNVTHIHTYGLILICMVERHTNTHGAYGVPVAAAEAMAEARTTRHSRHLEASNRACIFLSWKDLLFFLQHAYSL